MEINIRLQIPKDSKFVESLLLLLLRSDVEMQIGGLESQKVHIQPPLQPNSSTNIADRLYGIISLPVDFDYKSAS